MIRKWWRWHFGSAYGRRLYRDDPETSVVEGGPQAFVDQHYGPNQSWDWGEKGWVHPDDTPRIFPRWIVWVFAGIFLGMLFVNVVFAFGMVAGTAYTVFGYLIFSPAPGFINRIRQK